MNPSKSPPSPPTPHLHQPPAQTTLYSALVVREKCMGGTLEEWDLLLGRHTYIYTHALRAQ